MGIFVISRVIPRTYHDSVRLMRVSEELSNLGSVNKVFVAMGTDANKRVLDQVGLLTDSIKQSGANDLTIVVEAESNSAAESALLQAEDILERNNEENNSELEEFHPRNFEEAYKSFNDANVLFLSVPGPYAALEAAKALNANMNVMIFSDNVPIEDELTLKKLAVKKGLLLMGPGCGTAVINGIALGFANVLEKGPVGIVGASGTGLQELTTLLDRMEIGVSQVIGVGGRDLSDYIGGIMMSQAITKLTLDPATEVIVLISKPPDITVTPKILKEAIASGKPIIVNFMGENTISKQKGVVFTENIEDIAEAVFTLIGKSTGPFLSTNSETLREMAKNEGSKLAKGQQYIRGLFCGGSLCDEAIDILGKHFKGIYSNVAVTKEWKLENGQISKQHSCIDMGEEEFTLSRPHPMIDTSLRHDRILREAADPSVAVILLDVVIGYGSHESPASSLAEAIIKAKQNATKNKHYLSVVTHVCGSKKDPQGVERQEEILRNAGALVLPTNAQAAKVAAAILGADLNRGVI